MKRFLFYFFLSYTIYSNAQDFQGKAFYFSKTSIDLDFGRRQMSEDQKKAIAERLKSASEKVFVLNFNKEVSSYREQIQLETSIEGGGNNRLALMNEFTSKNFYKNIKEKRYRDQRDFFGKIFLIKDTLQEYNWTLINETKQIGNYMCFKAVAKKKISEQLDFRSIRRKSRERREQKNDSINNDTDLSESIAEEIEVVAWYTPEIPINQGPSDFWGLPGLILEIQQGRTTLLCNKIVLNVKETDEIKPPSKGKEVSQTEFESIAREKTEQMIEQFSTQRGRGSGRPRN